MAGSYLNGLNVFSTSGWPRRLPSLKLAIMITSRLSLLGTLAAAGLVLLGVGFSIPLRAAEDSPRFVIVIHGGAGSSPAQLTVADNAARREGLRKALQAGVDILKGGGSSLDAVEAAIRMMEEDPQFNAGRGAVLNAVGQCELDASIMDGRTKSCGAVASITRAKHPITVARSVMEKTRHVLLGGAGADAFAHESGADMVERDYFITEKQKAQLERVQARTREGAGMPAAGEAAETGRIGTVGCVAMDSKGNLAAGTSTGGLVNKRFGRIGDSPVVGAGTYADNATCAVSGTGIGEEFIRHAVAYDVSARMNYQKEGVQQAVRHVIHQTLKPGQGGLIAVDHEGHVAIEYNTAGMASAVADSAGRFDVNWPAGK